MHNYLFSICLQFYQPLAPGGNPVAVNKYHIVSKAGKIALTLVLLAHVFFMERGFGYTVLADGVFCIF
jgi:hypothetical protein